MQALMLSIFLSAMALASWSMLQQETVLTRDRDVDAVVNTVRELAQAQRLWHAQHGPGVPWQDQYLTHVPEQCFHTEKKAGGGPYPYDSVAGRQCLTRWARLGWATPRGDGRSPQQRRVQLWYCEITAAPSSSGVNRDGDRVPVFGLGTAPSCPTRIDSGDPAYTTTSTELVDRFGNPRGALTSASSQRQPAPFLWWDPRAPEAGNYATWATRVGNRRTLAGDHSFQVIYRADVYGGDHGAARALAQRVAMALGSMACVGRPQRETGSPGPTGPRHYECLAPGSLPASGPYYVIARYERPLARVVEETLLPRDGKLHAHPSPDGATGNLVANPNPALRGDKEVSLALGIGTPLRHVIGTPTLPAGHVRYRGHRLLIGCGRSEDCLDDTGVSQPHISLDARDMEDLRGGRNPLMHPELALRGTSQDSIRIIADPDESFARIGGIDIVQPRGTSSVVDGVENLSGHGGASVDLDSSIDRIVVCSEVYEQCYGNL